MPAPRRAVTRLAVLAAVAVSATGCSGKWSRGGWPAPVTDQGKKVLGLWQGSLIVALFVGAFVIGLILYSCVAFRRRSADELPRQVRYNLPIEVLYTMVPVVIISVLFYFTAIRENDEDSFATPPTVSIGVVGFQWSWQFNYLDNGLSVTGRPGEPPTLYLPVDKPIRFYETSTDVVHAFWVVPFLFKRDVIPGRTNSFELTVTKAGQFQGRCTEFCGTYHDRMTFTVIAEPWPQFQAWLAQTKAIAALPPGAPGSDPRFTVYTGPPAPTQGVGNKQRSTP